MIESIETLVRQFEERSIDRRQMVAALAALFAAPRVASAQERSPVRADTINHVSLAVTDVERSARFYQELLGLEVVSRPGNGGINLGLGDGFLGLYGLPDPGRVHHFCLGMENYDADRVSALLAEAGVEARVDRNPANRTSGGDQLYFNDPDGTVVQLSANGYQG